MRLMELESSNIGIYCLELTDDLNSLVHPKGLGIIHTYVCHGKFTGCSVMQYVFMQLYPIATVH